MKKIATIFTLLTCYFTSFAQTDTETKNGYMSVSTYDEPITIYMSPIVQCDIVSDYSKRTNHEFKIGEHFREYIKATYSPGPMSGTSKVWHPLNWEEKTKTWYNNGIESYRKEPHVKEVIVISVDDYKCDCSQ